MANNEVIGLIELILWTRAMAASRDVLPFFWFMRSAISRLRDRLGSKFEGEVARSTGQIVWFRLYFGWHTDIGVKS